MSNALLNSPYAFSVCRIEPENNIHVILAAFETIIRMPVVIVGNWSVGDYGRKLKARYSNNDHIQLFDPIYEQDRLNGLRANCTIYLHGHSCGGTNPSLVEAMYLGLPVIAFDVNFNRETTEGKARYFSSPEELRQICETIADHDLREIGAAMKETANRRYTWQRISECYSKLF